MPDKPLAPPFTVIERDESFEVADATGQSIAFLYFDTRSGATRIKPRLSKPVARKMAGLIARLPELVAETKKPPAGDAEGS